MGKKNPAPCFKDCFEYGIIRTIAFILRILPLSLAVALGRGLGFAVWKLDKRHRELGVQQVKDAYGTTISADEAHAVIRNMYRHFGTMLAEFVRMPSINAGNIDRYVDWGECDQTIKEAFGEGKGLIIASGHIGNWELSGFACFFRGYIIGAVARPLDNPLLDGFVKKMRQGSGQQIWDKYGALRRVVRVLRDGGGFGILVDQDARSQGLFVPFFGIEASTIPTPADLALLNGSPIITLVLHRTERPMRFVIRTGPLHRPDLDADKEAERRRLLNLVNQDLESLIRREPSQWLWIHRRWRTRPPDVMPNNGS